MKLKLDTSTSLNQKYNLSLHQKNDLNILELSNNELDMYIQKELEENPILEQDFEYETGYIKNHNDNFELMLNYIIKEPSLSEVVQKQIYTYRKKIYINLAIFLSDLLDENGYLKYSNKDIQNYFPQYSLDEIEETIQIIQTFEPYGIAARNLQECILIQLSFTEHPSSKLALLLVNEYLEEIADKKISYLSERLQKDPKKIQNAISLIQTLNPKPGSSYTSATSYINPDLYVEFRNGEIHMELFKSTFGLHINIDNTYKNHKETKQYLKDKKKKAQCLINGIHRRNNTLLLVTESIIKHQTDFFINGLEIHPLTMQTIAHELDFHESTVSRCISNKSMIFQNQIIPLKYFFTHSVSSDSSDTIKQKIKKIICEEDKKKPYSDQVICNILNDKKIHISRRTVAKYRDELNIPSAKKRKQY